MGDSDTGGAAENFTDNTLAFPEHIWFSRF
jgi:hypothetical protein